MVDGKILLKDLPNLDRAHEMSTLKLSKVLQHCPFCDTFGRPRDEITRTFSRAQMIDIISKLIFEVRKEPEMEPVQERSS